MTEQDKNMSENENNIETATQEPTETEATSTPNVDEQLKAKDARIAELEQALQLAKKNESEAMIRARAEIDNVRKRVEQDVEKAHKYALEKFSNELLPVIDNLERALESTDKANPEHQATVEGLELTLKSFLDTVKKFGIEVVNTDDSQLNPDLHQAISMVESPDHQSGQIINTIQKGYTLNGRLIRPAMVIVAK
ncbi:nucleotide exchange factor GrpE [Gilliamella sp. wkB108]|uniref:nucleotide exchange factor GrpE n=1 Tax=Gilliamella sp. wkB108 TaxID=3120256 RepID=UPI00080EA96F|nr:nucleotide exchange factor GrpE [Gilliamella apicola]OCG27870.1 nucleotide exchange factor GrpE [Gilliamella apicola]